MSTLGGSTSRSWPYIVHASASTLYPFFQLLVPPFQLYPKLRVYIYIGYIFMYAPLQKQLFLCLMHLTVSPLLYYTRSTGDTTCSYEEKPDGSQCGDPEDNFFCTDGVCPVKGLPEQSPLMGNTTVRYKIIWSPHSKTTIIGQPNSKSRTMHISLVNICRQRTLQ